MDNTSTSNESKEVITSKSTSSALLNIGRESVAGPSSLLVINKAKPTGTFRLPPSSVLSRVKQFLPDLAAANTNLQASIDMLGQNAVDIEHVEESERHIEMNIALTEGLGSDSDSADGDDGDDESDSGSEDSEALFGEVTDKNLKLSPQQKSSTKPGIEVLEEKTDAVEKQL